MKPSLPKGTRDFSPLETGRRRYIFQTIRAVFELYGYQEIETPAMEKLETLTGKYGEEGDRLIFKILNSGKFIQDSGVNISRDDLNKILENHQQPDNIRVPLSEFIKEHEMVTAISEKALRYDLTIPFARFVSMNRDKLIFPFRRFQIQPVWRADRPQKGRYREFWQCDADMVGSQSIINEAELIQIYDKVFTELNLPVDILINNRKILSGIAETIGYKEKISEITSAIDKLQKIGIEQVSLELKEKGLSAESIQSLRPVLEFSGSNEEKLSFLDFFLKESTIGRQGMQELKSLLDYFSGDYAFSISSANIIIDPTLARGLDYYTGSIFEVKARDMQFGSIGGGGRYDNLTGIFGLQGVSGVGISFGADRIYDVLLDKNLFPEESGRSTKVLFANFGGMDERAVLPLLNQLRNSGISAEIYPEEAKLKKQIEFSEKKAIPFFAVYGEKERTSAEPFVQIKELKTGLQKAVPTGKITEFFFNR